jgi:hypothetical protein
MGKQRARWRVLFPIWSINRKGETMSRKHNTKHRRGKSHYPDRLSDRGVSNVQVRMPFFRCVDPGQWVVTEDGAKPGQVPGSYRINTRWTMTGSADSITKGADR